MKVLKVSLSRLIVLSFAITGFIWAFSNCGPSSASGGKVASFLNSLPGAHLSNDQNNSIMVTALQQVVINPPLPGLMSGFAITAEVDSADPFYNAPYYFMITNITPTSVSGGLQVNNGVYVTDVTLSWVNAQSQGYDYSALTTVTGTTNGTLKEHGDYSYMKGFADISANGSLNTLDQYGDGSQDSFDEKYAGSWNANGYTPGSQSFSFDNTLGADANSSADYSPASVVTDSTTGLKIKNSSGNLWFTYSYNITGKPDNLNYNESDGSGGNGTGQVISGGSVMDVTAENGSGQVIHLQEQFSGTTFTVNGSGLFGEINEERLSGQLVSPPPAPPDFSGRVRVSLNNLIFGNSYCGYWPINGTMTVSSADTYIYDFSVNNSGTNCGCALVTINGVLTNNGQPVCGIDSAQPVYLSLSGAHTSQLLSRFKTSVRQPLLKK